MFRIRMVPWVVGICLLACLTVLPVRTVRAGMVEPVSAVADADLRSLRCLALVALAEAGGEGELGMAAVMKVMQNRATDGRFAADPCAVALEPGQFQPVMEQDWLRQALVDLQAGRPDEPSRQPTPYGAATLAAAEELARRTLQAPHADPTEGALYFLNPTLVDMAHCRWFATLATTAVIGRHLFLTDRRPPTLGDTLDCDADEPTRRVAVMATLDPSARTPMTPGRSLPRILARRPTELAAPQIQAVGEFAPRRRLIRLLPPSPGPVVIIRPTHDRSL